MGNGDLQAVHTLMQIIVNCVAFFELSDDDHVDPDTAAEQLEQIAWSLKKLSAADQTQLAAFICESAKQAERETGRDRRWQCLTDMPHALGLIEEDDHRSGQDDGL